MSELRAPLSDYMSENIRPMLYVTRLLGLAPFKIQGMSGKWILLFSKKYLVYSFIFGISLAACTIIGVLRDLQKDETESIRMKKALQRYITCSDIMIVIILILVAISNMFVRRNSYLKMLSCLHKVDTILNLKNGSVAKCYATKVLCVVYAFFLTLLVVDLMIWNSLAAKIKNQTFATINYIPFYFAYVIVFGYQLQYWLTVDCIRRRLVKLQDAMKLKNLSFRSYPREPSYKLIGGTEITPRQIAYSMGNISVQSRGNTKTLLTVDYVSKLIEAYENICKAVNYFNVTFGVALVIVIISCIMHLIVTPYFLVMELFGRKLMPFIVLQIMWIVAHSSRLLMITEPCHSAHGEVFYIKHLLCKLLTLDVEEGVKKQLDVFSNQMIQRNIYFSAFGLFRIDREAITSIAGTITTYLVILLQVNRNG